MPGGRDFDVFALHDHVYFGRHEDGMLESEFSGNLVEVCPTGVFDDKTLKRHLHAQMGSADGAVGLRALRPRLQHDPGRALRQCCAASVNRYNGEVNGYFLCDRGRFGYDFVNSARRLRPPLLRRRGRRRPEPSTKAEALQPSGAAAAPQQARHRHRLAARLARSQFRAARAGRRRPLLSRTVGEPSTQLLALIIEILRRGPARAAVAARRRAGRCRARARART